MKQLIGRLELSQRIVLVIGWGLALTFFGEWVATLHGYREVFMSTVCRSSKVHCLQFGSLPSQPVYTGLHPWAIMLVWVGLTVVGVLGALWVMRPGTTPSEPASA